MAAAAMTSVILFGNISGMMTGAEAQTTTPIAGQSQTQTAALNIAKLEIPSYDIPEDRIVSVDVRIDDNDPGFLAAEFGINYDDRLDLVDVVSASSAGDAFTYANNDNAHLAWFSAASGNASSTATVGRQTLFTLMFQLPEDCAIGDAFHIGYSWDSSAHNASYWYADKGVNQIDFMQTHSINGSIRIPDEAAPRLTYSEVQMNQRDTAAIGLVNFDGMGIWYTDHPEIAYFADPTVGEITAMSPGTCTAYCMAGSTLLMCDVTVTYEYFYSVGGSSPITITNLTDEIYLTYPNPEGSVIWMSTRPDLLSVNNNGKLTALKNGSCMVIGTSNGVPIARTININLPEATEPPATEAPTTEPETYEEVLPTYGGVKDTDPIIYGDVDCNGSVNLLDVVLLNKNLMLGVRLSENGQKAADVDKNGILNPTDSLTILKFNVRLVDSLPIA